MRFTGVRRCGSALADKMPMRIHCTPADAGATRVLGECVRKFVPFLPQISQARSGRAGRARLRKGTGTNLRAAATGGAGWAAGSALRGSDHVFGAISAHKSRHQPHRMAPAPCWSHRGTPTAPPAAPCGSNRSRGAITAHVPPTTCGEPRYRPRASTRPQPRRCASTRPQPRRCASTRPQPRPRRSHLLRNKSTARRSRLEASSIHH